MAEVTSAAPAPDRVEGRFAMRGIRKAFGATVALDGVDLEVRGGEVCALVGQNGAGKSTLMAILAGALAPDAGSMTLDGRPYSPRGPLDARRAGVAMIYQELSLAPDLSVMENILIGAEPARGGVLDWREMRARAAAALAELGHADIDPAAKVGTLSVAAQQLVEIARAIAVGCGVLVLDEPTSSLGRDDVRRLFALVGRLKAQGHAIVYISHFLEEVKEVADRVVVLRDGRNAGDASIDTPADAIVSMMVGRQVDDLFPHAARQPGDAVLDVQDLGPGSATFTLHRGEVFGIAGLVGAGRTRLLRAIFGLEPVRSGRVRIGTYTGGASPGERWQQGAGFLSEDRKGEGLALGLPIGVNVTLSRLGPVSRLG
jgi:ribose transport system ATP-binding protein